MVLGKTARQERDWCGTARNKNKEPRQTKKKKREKKNVENKKMDSETPGPTPRNGASATTMIPHTKGHWDVYQHTQAYLRCTVTATIEHHFDRE